MAKRDVIGRYSGSVLGLAWSFFNPLLMLAVYTFVFSVVFKARWGEGVSDSRTQFAMLLFTGMIVHGLFAECLNRAPTLILSNANYVKKVIFPLEILPWISFGSALFHAAISLLVLLLVQLTINQQLPWTAVLFPLVLVPLMLATMGLSWFVASLGVYIRDVGQVTAVFTMILLFMSGIFYPISALPEAYQSWMRLNPLTYIIEEGRNTLLLGKVPDFQTLGLFTAVALLVAWIGFFSFQRSRKGFADVV
ncbi:ABC transporter permease [Lysobacter sp. TAF61]|uniref:ABC transporter permease n=1 Tax=Lysobacter sp. TAF61 TaxID=3233072 RepID=UPI003F9CF535